VLKLSIPTHTKLHLIFKKIIGFLLYKKYFNISISVFAITILCSVLSLEKKKFWKLSCLQKYFFQNNCFDLLRSTGWSTDSVQVRTVNRVVDRSSDRWVRACVHVTWSTGRSTGPHIGRPSFGRLKAL